MTPSALSPWRAHSHTRSLALSRPLAPNHSSPLSPTPACSLPVELACASSRPHARPFLPLLYPTSYPLDFPLLPDLSHCQISPHMPPCSPPAHPYSRFPPLALADPSPPATHLSHSLSVRQSACLPITYARRKHQHTHTCITSLYYTNPRVCAQAHTHTAPSTWQRGGRRLEQGSLSLTHLKASHDWTTLYTYTRRSAVQPGWPGPA